MTRSKTRLVIVGGVAAGASAAARARRLCEHAEIIILEKGPDVSFANCGLPYHIGGEIKERSQLAIHTKESLAGLLNIQIKTNSEALKIDRENKTVLVHDHAQNSEYSLEYDKLLLAPGASPIRPPLPGIEDERIMTLRTLRDMDKIKQKLSDVRKVLVIGAGFIGLEMVEMLVKLEKKVALVELQEQVLPQLDPEMVKKIECSLDSHGVEIALADGLAEFICEETKIIAKLNSGKVIEADLVILSIGVRCESKLAEDAGLELGMRNSIKVNEYQQTSDPDIYAAGDVVETADPILNKRTLVPLGGPANRQGRVAADHIFLEQKARPYPGTIGTSIVRAFDVVAGITGYSEKRLRAEKIDYQVTIVTGPSHASYYPGALPIVLKVVWDPKDGRILGAQAIGNEGVDKRLDILSTAIKGKMTVEDLCHIEFAYAPPFGNARDVVNIAGFVSQNIQSGLLHAVYELPQDDVQIIDIRMPETCKNTPVPGAINIPFAQLRSRMNEIDKNKPVVVVCGLGKTSYFSHRALVQNGFDSASLIGGWSLRAL